MFDERGLCRMPKIERAATLKQCFYGRGRSTNHDQHETDATK